MPWAIVAYVDHGRVVTKVVSEDVLETARQHHWVVVAVESHLIAIASDAPQRNPNRSGDSGS